MVKLDDSIGFKGYPAAAEVLPASVPWVPCFYSRTPDANTGGYAALVYGENPSGGSPPIIGNDGGVPDAGPPDAGPPDAGPPDGGIPGAGPPDGGGGPGLTVFFDSFNRSAGDLGASWTVAQGAWRVDTRANSDRNAADRAFVNGLSCADCTVSADAVGFGTPVEVDLRVNGDDRYDLTLMANSHVQLRKHKGGGITVLADAASGLGDTGTWANFKLTASGSSAAALTGAVNGRAIVTATDTGAVLGAGSAGMFATTSGVWYRNFGVQGAGSGTPDGGIPDAGGIPDTGGGGPPGATLFSDLFNRNANDLGASWTVLQGAFILDVDLCSSGAAVTASPGQAAALTTTQQR